MSKMIFLSIVEGDVIVHRILLLNTCAINLGVSCVLTTSYLFLSIF